MIYSFVIGYEGNANRACGFYGLAGGSQPSRCFIDGKLNDRIGQFVCCVEMLLVGTEGEEARALSLGRRSDRTHMVSPSIRLPPCSIASRLDAPGAGNRNARSLRIRLAHRNIHFFALP